MPIAAQEEPEPPVGLKEFPKNSKKPRPTQQRPPVYPYAMSRAGLIGAVTIAFIIDKEGRVRNPYVVESNNPWFERPAIDAIIGWRFTPGEIDGRTVNVRAMQRIEFDLEPVGQVPELWQVTKSKDHAKLPPELRWETPPVPKSTMFPVYPFEQLKAGVEGRAKISYVVGPQGRVIMAKLLEAATPEFGQAVLAMIDAWRFQPAQKKDGTPAYARLGGEYDFKANGRGEVPVSDEAREILRLLEKKPEKIAAVKDLDQPPKPLSRRPPVYPSALLETGGPGEAVIGFFVDKNGDTQLPRIISSTAPEFGYAAVQAVATWRFEVPKKGGKPVVVRAQIPIEFLPPPVQPVGEN
ncbi:MAG: TonB family protein [Opitutae bacterium]|nr:TonB family protein [Opitutae bacterium]